MASTETSDASPSATPTLDPGPVALSDEAAAERYLKIVCANNVATDAMSAAFAASEGAFLEGGAPDPSAVRATAVAAQDLRRLAIEQLDDTYFEWPESVVSQIPHIRATYMLDMSPLGVVANASTFEEAYYVTWPATTPEQDAAGQEIRYQLDISADTTASCVGYESGLQELASELAEREEVLANQE